MYIMRRYRKKQLSIEQQKILFDNKKSAKFWRSQGYNNWAKAYENAKHRPVNVSNITHSINTERSRGEYKRPAMYQGVRVTGSN